MDHHLMKDRAGPFGAADVLRLIVIAALLQRVLLCFGLDAEPVPQVKTPPCDIRF
jgi:hypothetical protein